MLHNIAVNRANMGSKIPVIVITGASKGIGLQTALMLAKSSYQLALFSRNLDELQVAAQRIERLSGRKPFFKAVDIRNREAVNRALDDLIWEFGKVDVLINNAGIGTFKPAVELTDDDWVEVINTNTKGTINFTLEVLPLMLSNGHGQIVNVLSDAAYRSFENGSIYASSKWALKGFFESLRKEVQKKGIRITNINPGRVETTFAGNKTGTPEGMQWLQPEQVADVIQYVMKSPESLVIDEITLHPVAQDY